MYYINKTKKEVVIKDGKKYVTYPIDECVASGFRTISDAQKALREMARDYHESIQKNPEASTSWITQNGQFSNACWEFFFIHDGCEYTVYAED